MESEPLLPSPPAGTRGTGGPGRAGTAAAEELLLGWAEGEEEVQTVSGDDEEVEEGETAGEGARPRLDSGCSGTGGREEGRWRERGRDVGPGRDEEAGDGGQAGGAALRWRQEVAERTGPGSPQAGTGAGTGPETGAGGGSQRPGSDGASMFGLGAETGGSGSHSGSERTGFGSGTPEDEPGTRRPDSAGSEVQPGQHQHLSKNLRKEKMKTSQRHSEASR